MQAVSLRQARLAQESSRLQLYVWWGRMVTYSKHSRSLQSSSRQCRSGVSSGQAPRQRSRSRSSQRRSCSRQRLALLPAAIAAAKWRRHPSKLRPLAALPRAREAAAAVLGLAPSLAVWLARRWGLPCLLASHTS